MTFLPFRILFDSRAGQCIGPCAPSFATLPPAAPYAPLQYAPAHFASLPSSIPSTSEMPSKSTLQGKLRRRERAKAESSRKKEKGRAKQSDRRHRSSDQQSRGTPSKKTAQRQKKARSLPSCATAWTADPQPGRLTGAANSQRPLIGTGIEPSHGHQTQVPGFSAAVHSGHA